MTPGFCSYLEHKQLKGHEEVPIKPTKLNFKAFAQTYSIKTLVCVKSTFCQSLVVGQLCLRGPATPREPNVRQSQCLSDQELRSQQENLLWISTCFLLDLFCWLFSEDLIISVNNNDSVCILFVLIYIMVKQDLLM